ISSFQSVDCLRVAGIMKDSFPNLPAGKLTGNWGSEAGVHLGRHGPFPFLFWGGGSVVSLALCIFNMATRQDISFSREVEGVSLKIFE
ncbi:MAG: hypothetical protein L3J79_03790, partial [Candidatus Marinimicrobia bacterium]|nr:hypothetical protein [Candidatus Neomarinimicrobiota bacterium]